ncbi:glycosyltransferase family 4 protein [Chondromyces crocatus]|uniref:Glycosyltransferase n=1 Tax=Chondromyces crocatus TaxID=52 RepID=A0A0K1EM41_CHOCO|nr:glycosyltransferase family 4 protein [Chondromyces crocatus]AKT41683.1 uncharacterized protein CMC5_058890 [Chondromyces crocatus]
MPEGVSGRSDRLTVLLSGDPIATQQGRLGAALARRGHRVIVADAPGVARAIREEHGARCEEVVLERPRLPAMVDHWLARRAVRALGVDVVHLNYLRPRHRLWARMDGGPPYVATAWGSDLNDEDFPRAAAHAQAVDEVLRAAGALTADSLPLLERAQRRRRGAAEVSAQLVLWGVDLGAFAAERAAAGAAMWRERLQVPEGQRVLLSPRQCFPHYHTDRIVRAFARSPWARDGVLVLKLYGRAGEEADRVRLEQVAASAGVRERIRFAPPCAYGELPGLYALCDGAVSALEVDGFPSTFCELLALGAPLIATDLPAYRGLLEDERNALLVPAGSDDGLVGALERLATEEGLAARLRARGVAWAREVADWEACVDRFEQAYRAAMGRSSARG